MTLQEIGDYLRWRRQSEQDWLNFLQNYEEIHNFQKKPRVKIPRPDTASEFADFPCSRVFRDYIEDYHP